MKRKALIVTLCLSALTAVGSLGLPWFPRKTNCGGNTAALSYCHMLYTQLSLSLAEQGWKDTAYIGDLPEQERRELARLGQIYWTGKANYLIKRNVQLSEDREEIVVLCDTSFDNVPQPTVYNFYKRTSRYAVAMSNGKIKLITPEEFAKIDRSLFVKASELAENEAKP